MTYQFTRSNIDRDVRAALNDWLPARILPVGAAGLRISDLGGPDAGYSGKTVFFTASWTEQTGRSCTADLVLRTQAPDHQLFTEPDAARQAEVMQRLGRHPGIPVPQIMAIERDPSLLGNTFYVMRRVHGRTPSDVPSWHKRGWTTALSARERALLSDNATRALVAVHDINDADDLPFLRLRHDGSTALERYVNRLSRWYAWCEADLQVGADRLAKALPVIVDNMPRTDAETVVWGDARVGNMSFGPDLTVVALFDWEGATTGPPDIDVGWWLMFERFLCESLGFTRMPGVPDEDGFIERYQQLGGTLTGDIGYYQLLAAFTLSLINNRLAGVLIRDGLDTATARSYAQNAVALVDRYLEQL